MNRIFRFSFKDGITSRQYLASILIIIAISVNATINIFKVYSNDITTDSLPLFYHFMLSVFCFALIAPISLGISVLPEKLSGRCEYYLANNVSLTDLVDVYSKIIAISSLIPIFIYHIIVNVYFLFSDIRFIFTITLSWKMILFLIGLIIFSWYVSSYLVVLSMVSKKPDNIRTVLTIFSIVSINAVVLPMNYLTEEGVVFNENNITFYYLVILIAISIICKILTSILNKKLNNETVILSYKE